MKRTFEFNDPNVPEEDKIALTFGDIEIIIPAVTEENVGHIIESIGRHAHVYFGRISPIERARKVMEKINRAWSEKHGSDETVSALSQITGYGRETIRDFGFPVFEWFSDLKDMLDVTAHIGGRLRDRNHDKFLPVNEHGYLKAVGNARIKKHKPPEMVVHVVSGNVLGYTALPLSMGLVGLPQIVKASGEEPLSLLLYADDIGKEDPEFRKTFAVGYWKGGDEEVERRLYSGRVFMDVMGSDETVQNVRGKLGSRARMVGHGHKVGVGLVDKGMTNDDIVRKLATDVGAWDGYACFNVKTVFVYGDEKDAKKFAIAINEALKEFADKYGVLGSRFDRQLKAEEFLVYRLRGYDVIMDSSHTHFVRVTNDFNPPYILCRSVDVVPFDNVQKVGKELEKHGNLLQTAVVAAGDEKRLMDIAYALSDAGVTNIHRPGRANYLEPWEPHDGVFDSLIATGYEDGLRWVSLNLLDEEKWENVV